MEVTPGNGHALEVTRCKVIELEMKLADGKTKRCRACDVLYVPELSYNLLNVSKAAEVGKMMTFNKTGWMKARS